MHAHHFSPAPPSAIADHAILFVSYLNIFMTLVLQFSYLNILKPNPTSMILQTDIAFFCHSITGRIFPFADRFSFVPIIRPCFKLYYFHTI